MADQCGACGAWTPEGRANLVERNRMNPVHGTDFDRPKSEVLKEIRGKLTAARGGLTDFQSTFPGWSERTRPVEGLLTCGIIALYESIQELEKFEREAAAREPISTVKST